ASAGALALPGPCTRANSPPRQVGGAGRALNPVLMNRPRERLPTVDPACAKMPPAAVTGNVQTGIGLAGDVGHVSGDCCEAGLVEGEMRRAALRHPITGQAATRPHPAGGVGLGNWPPAPPP